MQELPIIIKGIINLSHWEVKLKYIYSVPVNLNEAVVFLEKKWKWHMREALLVSDLIVINVISVAQSWHSKTLESYLRTV